MAEAAEKDEFKTKSPSCYLDVQLRDDVKLHKSVDNLSACLDKITKDTHTVLRLLADPKLTNEAKIRLDIYMTYLISTLFWINLKIKGVNASKHAVMYELGRTKEMMLRNKSINEALAAPRLDMPAAKRFITAGMRVRLVKDKGVSSMGQPNQKAKLTVEQAAKPKGGGRGGGKQ